MSRVIVPISGGKSSAYCAKWAFDNYDKSEIVLYFNDTKWEHADLYRFLKELSEYFNHPIEEDSDGRNPEDVFYADRFLGNSRNGKCTIVLKAKRLQKFYKDGDIIIFGINEDEKRRAAKLQVRYEQVSRKLNKKCTLKFPLIENEIKKEIIDNWLKDINIKEPELYKLGFTHNNCSGGCVKAGKKQWKMLFEKLPEVYLERERLEEDWNKKFNCNYTILKGESLKDFRKKITENKQLTFDFDEDSDGFHECFGVCETLA